MGSCRRHARRAFQVNTAGAAFEFAVRMTHAKHAITRALALWETWIVVGSIAYLITSFLPWAQNGFPVVGR